MTLTQDQYVKLLEWTGCFFGLFGAALLASKVSYAGFGFVCFLISNGFWFLFAIHKRAKGLLLMQVGYTITSVIGIFNWIY
jgi:hypothetical protein